MKQNKPTNYQVVALYEPPISCVYNLEAISTFLEEDCSPHEVYAFLESMEQCLVEHAEFADEKEGQSERFLTLRQIKQVFGQIAGYGNR
ncbi:MAG: hypothetical protein WBA74_07815 [Cyclobacteriaceae bacterium]